MGSGAGWERGPAEDGMIGEEMHEEEWQEQSGCTWAICLESRRWSCLETCPGRRTERGTRWPPSLPNMVDGPGVNKRLTSA